MSESRTTCNTCGQQLDEAHDTPERQPCPNCGGLTRRYYEPQRITASETFKVTPRFFTGSIVAVGAAVEREDAVEASGTVTSPELVKALDSSRDYVIGVLDLSAQGRVVTLTINGQLVDLHASDPDSIGDVLLEYAIEIESREQGDD